MDLQALSDAVESPSAEAREAATARQTRLTKPAGALGRLEELSIWLAGVQGVCPPTPLDRVTVVVFAGDHGRKAAISQRANPAWSVNPMSWAHATKSVAARMISSQAELESKDWHGKLATRWP